MPKPSPVELAGRTLPLGPKLPAFLGACWPKARVVAGGLPFITRPASPQPSTHPLSLSASTCACRREESGLHQSGAPALEFWSAR